MRSHLIDGKAMKRKHSFQLIVSAACLLAGLTLIGAAFIVPPTGEIHSSVLVAYGETLSFVGALMGVDYHYKDKRHERDHEDKH